jgi:hypothetical protein
MEIKIEVTEKEIAERKAIWIDQQLQQYCGLDYWKRQSTENELLAEIRKKNEYGAGFYLTEDFKKQLQNTLKEQVQKLVDEELKRSQRTLQTIVQQFIFEKPDNLVQETLKDAIFTTQTDYQRQFEHHE